jgi:hypothetical protein
LRFAAGLSRPHGGYERLFHRGDQLWEKWMNMTEEERKVAFPKLKFWESPKVKFFSETLEELKKLLQSESLKDAYIGLLMDGTQYTNLYKSISP